MAVTGSIANAAKDQIPTTWDALAADSRYGDAALQRQVDLQKFRLFGTVVTEAQEDSLYNPVVIDYVGKLVALAVIPAGIEYWMVQKINDSSGEKISASWVDRAEKLKETYERLLAETRALLPEIQGMLGENLKAVKRSKPRMGVADVTGDGLVTSDPFGFEREYAIPVTTV